MSLIQFFSKTGNRKFGILLRKDAYCVNPQLKWLKKILRLFLPKKFQNATLSLFLSDKLRFQLKKKNSVMNTLQKRNWVSLSFVKISHSSFIFLFFVPLLFFILWWLRSLNMFCFFFFAYFKIKKFKDEFLNKDKTLNKNGILQRFIEPKSNHNCTYLFFFCT